LSSNSVIDVSFDLSFSVPKPTIQKIDNIIKNMALPVLPKKKKSVLNKSVLTKKEFSVVKITIPINRNNIPPTNIAHFDLEYLAKIINGRSISIKKNSGISVHKLNLLYIKLLAIIFSCLSPLLLNNMDN